MSFFRWARTNRAAVTVAFLGLTTTALVAYASWRDHQLGMSEDLAERGNLVVRLLDEAVGLARSKVGSLQAFLEASEAVNAIEFSRFSLHQGRSPGMVALGFARIVDGEDWESFMDAAQEERPHFVGLEPSRRPIVDPDPARRLVPVWFRQQDSALPPILGLDLAADPARREAIEASVAGRATTASGFVEVLGDPGGTYVEIYTPVHGSSAGGPGVAFATVDVYAFLRTAEHALVSTQVEIVDATGEPPTTIQNGPEVWTDRLEVVNRDWEIVVTPTTSPGLAPLFVTVTVTGLVITALMTVVVGMVVASRNRRRELADLKEVTRAKDVFLASVAHELRTPLTSVVGITALLAEDWEQLDREEIGQLVTDTHAEATDLAYLIDDLLVAGRLEAGAINYRTEPVDLTNEVGQILDRLTISGPIVNDLPSPGPVVLADPLRLRQIVRNIVVNACRYASAQICLEVDSKAKHTVLRIRNDGPPIPPEIEEVLFEPYQRGRDRPITRGSIGLGLPISKRLAKAMDGDLLYRYVDGWCTFEIHLPNGTPPTGNSTSPHSGGAASSGQSRTSSITSTTSSTSR